MDLVYSIDFYRSLESLAAEEIMAGYQYQVVSPYLAGMEREAISEFLSKTATDEVDDHFKRLQQRMAELGYVPRSLFLFDEVSRLSRCEYVVVRSLSDLAPLMDSYVASEQCAIDHYQEFLNRYGSDDAVTRRMIEEIMADEWEHLEGFRSFADDIRSFSK
jgi:bacterioferritin